MSNPLKNSIQQIAREVVGEYRLPLWGVVRKTYKDNEEGSGIILADVVVKDNAGNPVNLTKVPVMLGGKGIQDVQLKPRDRVKVVFNEGRQDDPAIIQVVPEEKKNQNSLLSIIFGWF